MKTVLSFGGGLDSSTLIAIDLNRDKAADILGITRSDLDAKFPSPDLVVFADTGAESDSTYATVDRFAALLGDRFIKVARNGETITEWCLRLGIVPVVKGGGHRCSIKFKGAVIQAALQDLGPINFQIGLEADELGRAKRFSKPTGDLNDYSYPLIELGLSRHDCEVLIEQLGFDQVQKSACVFCPFASITEIRDRYLNDPAGWDICVEVEETYQATSPIKHQKWIDGGKRLTKGGKAFHGEWRVDSWGEGNRLFAKTIQGRQLSTAEWADYFDNENLIPLTEEAVG